MAVSRLTQTSLQNGFEKFGRLWDGRSAVGSMEPISAITLSAAQASVEFNNIPGTYSHLQLRYFSRNSTNNYFVRIRFNSNTTATDYTYHVLNGTGSSITIGYENDGMYAPRQTYAADTFSGGIVDILDYANTNKNKTIRGFGGFDANGSGNVDFISGMWLKTTAVTSIQLTAFAGTYQQYSSFSLYGIR